jgi:hypothetical protein
MRKIIFIIIAFYSVTTNAEIRNFEAKGNLESRNPVACVDINGISNKNTPADIFIGFEKCLGISNYQNSSELYLAALAYGLFDSKRVEDKTAHQAISVLRLKYLNGLNNDTTKNFKLELKKTTENISTICNSLKKLGAPDYYPNYMIKHGMGAFLGNKSRDGLVSDFDSSKAWEDVLKNYVKCPM